MRPRTAGAKPRSFGSEDDHLLREKIRLLETDRKSFFESSQNELKRNRDEIRKLRAENSELKAVITAAKKASGSVTDTEVKQLDNGIYRATLKLDELHNHLVEKQMQIDHEKHVLSVIQIESEPLLNDESYLTRRIRMLENRLDKSLIKYNEALAIKKTYEHIVARLKDERVGFDNQLSAIERTLAAKDHDYQELLKMSHSANHAKELAKKELQDFKAAFDEERKQKDRELAERKLYVQNKVDQTQKLERKEKSLRQKEAEEARAKQEEEQAVGRNKGSTSTTNRSSTDAVSAEEEERLSHFENAFRVIKEATGISDVNELLVKYVNHEETRRNLDQMVRDAQHRIDDLNLEKAELTAKLEELRYTGSGQLGSRRIVEEFEMHLVEATQQTEANGEHYEQLAKLLINVKAGVEHLVEKLALFRADVLAPPVTDDTLMDALKIVEQKLVSLADEVVPADTTEDALISTTMELPQHNRRIKLMADDEEGDEGLNDAVDDQDDDAVLKRDQVKKISANSIQRETKKLRRKKVSK